ncbi:hypothetical protein B0H17DRAFT_1273970 [Mycena rosella]|uniref:Uncharacterized protein n=1 Tax=Mycena rosella TaxID=1033263 RepID=A0AAD7GYY0_MYCRO|nr:hypothetical protein B0H17DRAFT_1273970 [Mycena rosella]
MFVLASIGLGGNAKFNEMTFIDDCIIPGGPNTFTFEFFSTPVNIMALVAYILMSWLADGLVIPVFPSPFFNNYKYWLSAFPALVYLGSVVSFILLIISSTKPDDPFWSADSVQFGTAYWSLSIALNILLTISIVIRIWFVRRQIRTLLGTQHSGQYISIAAMLIESAALYAVWSTVFLVSYARQSPLENILLPAQGQIQVIAPLLILFRVAQGRAWSRNTLYTTKGSSGSNHGIQMSDFTARGGGEASYGTQQELKVNMTTDTIQSDPSGHKVSAV